MNAYTLDDYNRKASEDKLSDIDNDEKETLLSKISPKTGDKIIYYIAIIAISLVAIIILIIIKIKNKNQKKIKK